MTKTIFLAAIIATAAIAPLITFASFSQNEAEAAPIPKAACPAQYVQHWDKIIFTVEPQGLIIGFISPPGETELIEGIEYDVKVRDFPDELANLKEKTADKLNELGYRAEIPLGQTDIIQGNIVIIDIEYAIVCAVTPDPPIVR